MKAAVIGAGVFGCVAAIDLARAGVDVDLYDSRPDVLLSATRSCQGRLHRGYHYPRSGATAAAAENAYHAFSDRFPECVTINNRHHYLIAAENSKTTTPEFLNHCKTQRLPYRACVNPLANSETVDSCFRVPEAIVDVRKLRARLRHDLYDSVTLRLGAPAPPGLPNRYDRVVDCTNGGSSWMPLRYELCETVLIRLGAHYARQSFVVMDGPFISLDPVPGSALHMLYHVRHSVHHVSDSPEVPAEYAKLVNQGLQHTKLTHMDDMLQGARRFLRAIGMPIYCGSLFTMRAVLPDVEDTDARPTLVEQRGSVVRVLSGKIGTSVPAAAEIVKLVAGART